MTSICALKRSRGVEYTVEWNGERFVDIPLDWSKVVYCGRRIGYGWNLPESRWSNRIPMDQPMTLDNYSVLLASRGVTSEELAALRGKKLACWCYGKKVKDPTLCHTWLLKLLVESTVLETEQDQKVE